MARPPHAELATETVVLPDLWRLGAQPRELVGSAARWRDLVRVVNMAEESMGAAATTLLRHWRGESARTYESHWKAMADALAALSTVASRIAETLDDVASVLHAAQGHLDESWCRIRRAVPASDSTSEPVFGPTDAAGAARVAAAAAEAREIRADAERRLAELADALHGLRWRLWSHASTAMTKEGEGAAWVTGGEPVRAGQVIVDGSRVIINGTGRADDIRVDVDARTGERVVTIGAVGRRLPVDADLVIRAGAGDDAITVSPGSRVNLTLITGAGDDRVRGGDGAETVWGLWGRDTVESGGGADRVFGGADADYIDGQGCDDLLDGGLGDDTLYGLDGADLLWGGHDRDYLDGGAGVDRLAGAAAADVAVGGRGVDTLHGGADDDALYGGDGADRMLAGAGFDRTFGQSEDVVSGAERNVTVELHDVGGFIRIEGSPDFAARVRSDLDALRASERGQMMLDALQRGHEESRSPAADWPVLGSLVNRGHTLTIRETGDANGYADRARSLAGQVGASIGYNPRFDDLWNGAPVPPVVVLYHELAHVYDYFDGTLAGGVYTGADNPGVPNRERAAVGLPFDHDADPDTPERMDPRHPFEFTENGLRAEYGRSPRTRY
jgi:uncharacterized protein YukE